MKRFFFCILSVIFLIPSTAHADRSTASWRTIPEFGTGVGVYGATYSENLISIYPSLVKGANRNSQGGSNVEFVCDSAKDAKCINSDLGGYADMIIPACEVDSSSMCIEGLSAGRAGNLVATKYLSTVKSRVVEGDLSKKIPNGYNQSRWRFDGGNGFETQDFSVYVLYRASLNGQVQNFQTYVSPYTVSRDSRYQEQTATNEPISDGGQRVVGSNGDFGCTWIEAGECGKPALFQKELRLELRLRVNDGIVGWLSGRLKAPEISVEPYSASLRRLVVSGEPVYVQKAYAKVLTSEAPSEIKTAVRYTGIKENEQYLFTSTSSDRNAIEFFNLWSKYWPDNAQSVESYWGFTTLAASDQPCLSDKSRLIGLVTTNAMVYDGRPPQFDNGEISYRVASVHNDDQGKQFQGVYDLVIDSKVARCLYKYSDAPISASISITSSEGNQNIATTVINEKNGWFRMGAYGFHYSSPTIKVKLTQEQSVVTAPVSSSKPIQQKSAQKTITCVKGKTTKKVTSANPKCPAGYKKK